MKAFALLVIVGILTSADQGKISKPTRAGGGFDYATQIGIVLLNDDGQLRLAIKNQSLDARDEVVIVDPYEPQKTARALIEEKVSGVCSREGFNEYGGDCYKLKAVSGKVDEIATAFGIVKTTASFKSLKGLVSADLDNDGVAERFRVCTSMEGLHLTVWSGIPIKGKRRWHRYFYLGYDVEPNCKDGEGEEMPDK
jgi:hypothetical protein